KIAARHANRALRPVGIRRTARGSAGRSRTVRDARRVTQKKDRRNRSGFRMARLRSGETGQRRTARRVRRTGTALPNPAVGCVGSAKTLSEDGARKWALHLNQVVVVLPTLIVVSGPPGSGKTTLAHAIGRAVPCPAICRDEIKEGLVHAERDKSIGGVSQRTFETFFGVLRLLLSAGVTVVAEAAFQDKLWRPGLEPLLGRADIRIVHCIVDPALARERI